MGVEGRVPKVTDEYQKQTEQAYGHTGKLAVAGVFTLGAGRLALLIRTREVFIISSLYGIETVRQLILTLRFMKKAAEANLSPIVPLDEEVLLDKFPDGYNPPRH